MNLRAVVVTGLSVALCAKLLGAQGVTPFDTLKARALLVRYFAHGTLYAQAVRRDRSLVPAHFQLARLDLVGGNARGALRNLRRGIAFDSSNASAAETARRLAAALSVR